MNNFLEYRSKADGPTLIECFRILHAGSLYQGQRPLLILNGESSPKTHKSKNVADRQFSEETPI